MQLSICTNRIFVTEIWSQRTFWLIYTATSSWLTSACVVVTLQRQICRRVCVVVLNTCAQRCLHQVCTLECLITTKLVPYCMKYWLVYHLTIQSTRSRCFQISSETNQFTLPTFQLQLKTCSKACSRKTLHSD